MNPPAQARRSDSAPSDALVIFGFTGDLASKKIFPALYAMVKKGELSVPVLGVASTRWSADQLHRRVRESIEQAGGIDDQPAFDRMVSLLRYVSGDYNDPSTFDRLKEALAGS
jgi:glucose-6-phosphate 1-dehydrogenase